LANMLAFPPILLFWVQRFHDLDLSLTPLPSPPPPYFWIVSDHFFGTSYPNRPIWVTLLRRSLTQLHTFSGCVWCVRAYTMRIARLPSIISVHSVPWASSGLQMNSICFHGNVLSCS
jgi:hypothetical protein